MPLSLPLLSFLLPLSLPYSVPHLIQGDRTATGMDFLLILSCLRGVWRFLPPPPGENQEDDDSAYSVGYPAPRDHVGAWHEGFQHGETHRKKHHQDQQQWQRPRPRGSRPIFVSVIVQWNLAYRCRI